MRILIGHNHYQVPGGEDAVVRSEYSLLQSFNEEVFLYERDNRELNTSSPFKKLEYFSSLAYSRRSYQDIKKVIKEFKPDVAHFHNLFYTITPSVYYACKEEGVPVVQTLHNFRLLCSNGLFYRQGKVCEECAQTSLWRGVKYGCFQKSRLKTAVLVGALDKHWKKGTWVNMVDRYIALSEFSRDKFVRAGIDKSKISVKPNFVSLSGDHPKGNPGQYAVYMGRLSEEKGIKILLKAWRSVDNFVLKVVGDGPLIGWCRDFIVQNNLKNIELIGFLDQNQCQDVLAQAKFLIVPSQCFENFPRAIIEAFALGVPVLASRIGSLQEIVKENCLGRLFAYNREDDLSEQIKWMIASEEQTKTMARAAQQAYQDHFNEESNYRQLKGIYEDVIR